MKAMILAAGFGTRLFPLTIDRTKPAIPFLGKPLVGYVAEYVARFGIDEVVVNLQGDLPTLDPKLVHDCLAPLAVKGADIATLGAVITLDDERTASSVVKIVGSPLAEKNRLRALYFTRATAPYGDGPLYHHIGIYAYRRKALEHFVSLPPSPLEKREKLEQLRALEAGMRIDVTIVDTLPLGVDTPADLERARRELAPKK